MQGLLQIYSQPCVKIISELDQKSKRYRICVRGSVYNHILLTQSLKVIHRAQKNILRKINALLGSAGRFKMKPRDHSHQQQTTHTPERTNTTQENQTQQQAAGEISNKCKRNCRDSLAYQSRLLRILGQITQLLNTLGQLPGNSRQTPSTSQTSKSFTQEFHNS